MSTKLKVPEGHSPLGGSGASRWMKCPGSVSHSRGIIDEESDHAAVGTAAHALAEHCLRFNLEAWSSIGVAMPNGVKVDKPMADAVQMYLDFVRREFGSTIGSPNAYIEHRFYCPSVHKLFFGATDFAYVDGAKRELVVIDYKNGAGIVVEAKRNPQGMYYAVGMLEDLGLWHAVDTVRIIIVQPNGFHHDGPIREWTVSTDDLDAWLSDELVPAMKLTEVSRETVSGEHCRFCPARSHACPALVEDMNELEDLMTVVASKEKGVEELTNGQVERLLELYERATIVVKAAKLTAFNRLQNGATFVKWKLGNARVNREWKEEAEKELLAEFGEDAYEPKTLKSPAKIEALPKGKTFTARWAYKPEAGLALIRSDDARPAVNRDTKSLFTPVKKGRKAS